jgi:hypothetical protein
MPRNLSETKSILLNVLDCAFDRRSWHGANFISSLRGVRAKSAAKRFGSRKTIWQQVLHAAYWKHVVLNKLAGTTPFGRAGSNWLKMPKPATEAAWRADVQFLRDEHAKLRRTIEKLPARKLDARTIWLIHGVAAHDVYHAGQIKLLRRLIRG